MQSPLSAEGLLLLERLQQTLEDVATTLEQREAALAKVVDQRENLESEVETVWNQHTTQLRQRGAELAVLQERVQRAVSEAETELSNTIKGFEDWMTAASEH